LEMYREVNGLEVCVAILKVTGKRDDGRYQAEPAWIASNHKRDLQRNTASAAEFRLRLVSSRALLLVQKCVSEGK
jgi:hypothetical protein